MEGKRPPLARESPPQSLEVASSCAFKLILILLSRAQFLLADCDIFPR